MTQTVVCDSCGESEFTDLEREYYSMRFVFECANCGAKIEVREPEDK
jgi:transcription elongation factor Elf1